jgi:hypothetical protein
MDALDDSIRSGIPVAETSSVITAPPQSGRGAISDPPPVADLPCPTDKHYRVHLDEACNAGGRTIENLKLNYSGNLANAVVTGHITSDHGLVGNITLETTAVLEGGYVTSSIVNKGLMKNFEFRGAKIEGGTLAGTVIIASRVNNEIRDVTLAAGAVIQGKSGAEFKPAKLAGKIQGTAENPAKLENVTIVAATQLDNVVIGKAVILKEGVVLGKNVTFSDDSGQPPPLPTCEPNALGLNAQGKEINNSQSCFSIEPGKQTVKIKIQVDSAHVGQKADLLVVIRENAVNQWHSLDKTQWKTWNGNLDNLKAKESFKVLPEIIELEIARTEFSELGDQLTLFVGYQLPDGNVIYNAGESL